VLLPWIRLDYILLIRAINLVPLFVLNGIELAVVSPSMTDPTNMEADAAQPIKDLKIH
jgi:hypothetical protein